MWRADPITKIVVLLSVASVGVSLMAMGAYSGSATIYMLFSLVYALILLLGVARGASYVVLYVGLLLWLGFWAKTTAHLLIHYPFREPTGNFDFSSAAWDDVLLTAIAGGLGILCAALIWAALTPPTKGRVASQPPPAPRWYASFRVALWVGLVLVVAMFVVTNETFRILKLGWQPRVVLPWPLGGLFAWTFYVGAAIIVAVMAGWDRTLNAPARLSLSVAFATAWALAVSMMSRSAFLFQAGPYLVAILRERKLREAFGWKSMAALLVLFAVLFGTSLAAVTYSRYIGPNALPVTVDELSGPKARTGQPTGLQAVAGVTVQHFLVLAIDRWIGLEGVMTVSAYPSKSLGLLSEIAKTRRTPNRVDFYTRISGSSFTDEHAARFQYATNPGAVALLYLSGSKWIVFLGMLAIGLAAIAMEVLVARLFQNPFLTSLVGMYFAVVITILTLGLPQLALSVVAVVGLCAALALFASVGRGGVATVVAESKSLPPAR